MVTIKTVEMKTNTNTKYSDYKKVIANSVTVNKVTVNNVTMNKVTVNNVTMNKVTVNNVTENT